MTAQATTPDKPRLAHQWPTPPTAKELDARFPGILDGAMLLSGGANIILQLALPAVGYGVAESRVTSGSILHHPIKRSRTTFTYLTVALMGSREEKLAYRKAVNRSHAQVHSTEASPVKYDAFDENLQMWVAACLYWGFMDAHQKLHGPVSRDKQAEFYALARPLGTTLQVREDTWPQDLDAFEAYWEQGLARLHIDDRIRDYLMMIADLRFLGPVPRVLFGRFNRFMTTGFLPPLLREQMQLPWNERQQRRFERTVRTVGRLSLLLPRIIRQMPYNLVMWDFRRRLRRGKPLV
ncbi:oxygenase MpaB family protein [Isoalcanivorax indicus]|uniref:oxygenase MpaB family protein n=1 Tax=Isoalcanivorax indicus TaxID=2202653 RepID=UPI000DBA4C75|nr:oxygenase MpaB family protein [Isoalcanivorax indicus]